MNLEKCKKACLSETSFICKSFDVIDGNRYSCNLSSKAKGDKGVKMVSDSRYRYYQRIFSKVGAKKSTCTFDLKVAKKYCDYGDFLIGKKLYDLTYKEC